MANDLLSDNTSTIKINNADLEYNRAKRGENALEEIQSENFAKITRRYYAKRHNDSSYLSYSHADIMEKFYNDRSWRTNNSVAMGLDLNDAMKADAETLKDFNYITKLYQDLPSFWNDPNRNFGTWLMEVGGAVVADPINLIGFGVGGQAAKQGYKIALKEALKGKIAKEISEQTIKMAADEAKKKAMGAAIKKGAIYEGMIGAGVAGMQDSILQSTYLKSGLIKERDLKQTAIASAVGGTFGTVFGGVFSGIGFKLTSRGLKKKSIKNLQDLHTYGRSEITGSRLFSDLTTSKDKKSYYKNLTKDEIDAIETKSKITGKTLDEKLKNLHRINDGKKSLKEPINFTKYTPRAVQVYLRSAIDDALNTGKLDYEIKKFDNKKAIELSQVFDEPIEQILLWAKKAGEGQKEDFVRLLIYGDWIAKQGDDQLKLGNELHRAINEGKLDEAKLIEDKMDLLDGVIQDSLIDYKKISTGKARATQIQRVGKDARRAAELIANPEDPAMQKLKTKSSREYKLALGKLDDHNQVILALQNAKKVDKWELAAEYINNNLLSSPDTHILNIVSGLAQTQWKPFVMLLRSANMGLWTNRRSRELAIEAFDTYIHQYVYLGHAIKQFGKSFYFGRGMLDSRAMKYDNSMRQGQLQAWINATSALLTRPLGKVGGIIHNGLVKPTSYLVTTPMRFLSAGDEFLKTVAFRARRTSQIHSQLRKENNASLWSGYFKDKKAKEEYKKRFKEIEMAYMENNNVAKSTISSNSTAIQDVNKLEVNDPLQYAREATYTQSSMSTNPATGKQEGGVTAAVLSWTSRNKWSRALGLHFINTPSNLIKWNFEQIPLARRLVVSTRHALMKGADGKYLNPEAAAEANARMQGGMMLWFAAYNVVLAGKITGGGSRDWRENKERTATTGWQPYSYITDDGRYIKLNRLDPIMMPFFIMADMMETINSFLKVNEDLPAEAQNGMEELAMGVLASLTHNLTSKFYMKGIIETAGFLLGDEAMKSKAPDRIGTSILSRAIYKVFPLSGGLRYMSRVDSDVQQELWSLSDRMLQLDPFEWVADKDSIMPQRNMFGEKVDRQNGWLFGLGKESGLWSSPFAMTQWSNPEIGNFFKDREFKFTKPSPIDRKSKIDLRRIVNDKTKQTAYDRWRELTGQQTFSYKGKKYNLKGYIEALIMDKKSAIYFRPDGQVLGEDMRQKYIISIVRRAERMAKIQMMKEYPIIQRTINERNEFKFLKVNEAIKNRNSSLNTLLQ